jgi:hypothetical protein
VIDRDFKQEDNRAAERWYVIDTEGLFNTFSSATAAEDYAEQLLDQERDRAWGGEWDPDTANIEWGRLDVHEQASVVHREPDETGNTDELVDYGLVVVR